MNLKLLKIPILMTGATLMLPFAAIAANPDTTTQDTYTYKGKLERSQNPKYKRAPGMCIEYEYINTGIILYPSNIYTTAEVTVFGVDCGVYVAATLSEDNGYYIETGEMKGEIFITCTVDNGSVYTGSIEIL